LKDVATPWNADVERGLPVKTWREELSVVREHIARHLPTLGVATSQLVRANYESGADSGKPSAGSDAKVGKPFLLGDVTDIYWRSSTS